MTSVTDSAAPGPEDLLHSQQDQPRGPNVAPSPFERDAALGKVPDPHDPANQGAGPDEPPSATDALP